MSTIAYDCICLATFAIGVIVGWVIAMDDKNGMNDDWRWRWK